MTMFTKLQNMSRPAKALTGAALVGGLLFAGVGAANAATADGGSSTRVQATTALDQGDPTSAPLSSEGGSPSDSGVPATTPPNQGDPTSAALTPAE